MTKLTLIAFTLLVALFGLYLWYVFAENVERSKHISQEFRDSDDSGVI